jgi:hypothetical protein|tara:strand:- start:101 stop:310 length:210 start_codon:yes stop_codon:yes gene_type:complete
MDYFSLSLAFILLGAVAIYFTHKQAYEKGITTAVLLHRNGRLKYRDYLDDKGDRMVDIEIEPIDEGDEE